MYTNIIKKKRVNKKAQIQQIILFFVVIFAVTVSALLGRYILNTFYDAFDDAGLNTPETLQAQNTLQSNYMVMDYSIVLLSIVLIIGLMITSFLIPTHPAFLVLNIAGIFILVFLGMVLTNVYGELVAGETQVLGDVADEFNLSNYLITRLPYFGAIVIFISSVIMYSRSVT